MKHCSRRKGTSYSSAISRQIELIQRERESIHRRIHKNYLKGISRYISRHTTTSDY